MAVAFEEPRPFADVLPWASKLERLGVTGFGWGVAWLEEGVVHGYRRPVRLADDPEGRDALRGVASSRFVIHFRRPSKLSTVDLADTQPFVEEDGGFAFCHNGYLDRHREVRSRFASVLRGRADSEVGFRFLQAELESGRSPEDGLAEVHRTFGGRGNFAYLGRDGAVAVYAGNAWNAMWRFRIGDAVLASTALHSDDDSLFTLLYPDARERSRVEGAVALEAAATAPRA